MSGKFLRHGAVWAGVTLLAAGLLAAQGPADDANPFEVPKKAEAKPAPQPPKKAQADPFGAAANPFDPFAAPKKPDAKPADGKPAPKGPAMSGRPKGRLGKTGARGVAVEPGAAGAAIEKALAQTVEEFEFDQTPLSDVIAQLQRQYKINIVLDTRALEGMSIDPSTTLIAMRLKGISLRSALELMLRQVGLTWIIHSEVLFITTADEAERILITKVYDVADLVRCRDEKDVPWDDYDSVIDAIENTISPGSWSDTGAGAASIVGQTFGSARVLIVHLEYRLQTEVAKLLDEVRKVGAKSGSDQKPPMRPRAAKTNRVSRQPTGAGYMCGPPAGSRKHFEPRTEPLQPTPAKKQPVRESAPPRG